MRRDRNAHLLSRMVGPSPRARSAGDATALALDAFFFLFVGGLAGTIYVAAGFSADLTPLVILLAGLGAVTARHAMQTRIPNGDDRV